MTDKKIVLLTTVYKEPCSRRAKELLVCLEKNILNPWIDEIILFTESDKLNKSIRRLIEQHNIKLIKITARPTYHDFFDYANKNLKREIVIICNSDIYFDDTLKHTLETSMTNKFYVLSRWTYADDGQPYLPQLYNSCHPIDKIPTEDMYSIQYWVRGHHPAFPKKSNKNIKWVGADPINTNTGDKIMWRNEYTADAWIFEPPHPLTATGPRVKDYKIALGTFRCDTMLNYLLIKEHVDNGLDVTNPCLKIKCYHQDYYRTEADKNYYNDDVATTDDPKDVLYRCFIPWI